MVGEVSKMSSAFDGFVRPELSSNMGESNSGLIYSDGVLYRKNDQSKATILNDSLPVAEWYEVVEIAQNPTDEKEIWLAIGGRELHCSYDGGKSFTKISTVSAIADISFVPWLKGEKDFVLYLIGTLMNGQKGAFIAMNRGNSWMSYDLCDALPLS